MKLAGIDLSMSCPAISVYDTNDSWCLENIKIDYLIGTKKYIGVQPYYNMTGNPLPEYNTNEERWNKIADWCLSCTKDCEYVNIESQSYGSMSSMLCQISEMHGVVKNKWFLNGISIKLTPPSQNKKEFSGRGNATKLEMISSFNKKFDIDILELYNVKGNNLHPWEDISDSIALLELLYKEKKNV